MALFRKGYELTLNRVHDTITIKENDEELKLTVNADPMRLVAGLNNAQKKLTELTKNKDATDEETLDAAKYFASTIFGPEQAEKLLAFYANDPGCVITVCGQYFRQRLANLIAKQQKKMKV